MQRVRQPRAQVLVSEGQNLLDSWAYFTYTLSPEARISCRPKSLCICGWHWRVDLPRRNHSPSKIPRGLEQWNPTFRKVRERWGTRQAVMVECHKNPAAKLLRTMPFFGPLRAAVLIARVQTPHRFRTKRQFWTYCGPGVGDAQQRRLCGERWTDPTAAQAGVHSRAELELQPGVEKCFQERGHDGERDVRSAPSTKCESPTECCRPWRA